MSPYLFTLVTEVLTLKLNRNIEEDGLFHYHPKCHKQKSINVCFADDLIMFAYGNKNSTNVLKNALNEFNSVSGLTLSLPKSTTFFCIVSSLVKKEILDEMPFEKCSLPIKYLGSTYIFKINTS